MGDVYVKPASTRLWARTLGWLLETLPGCYTCQRLRETGELSEKTDILKGTSQEPHCEALFLILLGCMPAFHPASGWSRLFNEPSRGRSTLCMSIHTPTLKQSSGQSRLILQRLRHFYLSVSFAAASSCSAFDNPRKNKLLCLMTNCAHLPDVNLRWFKALCTEVY